MVEVLRAVIEADGGEKLFVQNLPHLLRISVLHCAVQIPEILLRYFLAEPPQNRILVDGLHLRIGNPGLQVNGGFAEILALFRQLSGKIEKIPQILAPAPHVLIGDFLVYLDVKGSAA